MEHSFLKKKSRRLGKCNRVESDLHCPVPLQNDVSSTYSAWPEDGGPVLFFLHCLCILGQYEQKLPSFSRLIKKLIWKKRIQESCEITFVAVVIAV